ncbi:MAG: 2-oxoacid:acceptor oxidoreductase family protein [Eubacteriales bacterium]|nr:2-oxoacid:acceptor oxidoreductase family protein [Eubacteriales bacterium]MDY3332221.1 2-oxoacid:acceptor oxidoreductase family protein [Gallibacter sp.]
MSEAKKIFIAGFGGQGVLLIGQLLSYGAMYQDKEVTWMPSYGPEMRGGTANCTVCISDDPIASPFVSDNFDVLIAMNAPSLEKFEGNLKPGGELFINTSVVHIDTKRTDVNVHKVDCNRIAIEEVGSDKSANMVMLGAIINVTKAIDLDIMEKVFDHVFTGGKAKFIPSNLKALTAWKPE